MTKAMGQKYSVQTFDQQLYSIAKQVAWTMPDTFRNHILHLAGFHSIMLYCSNWKVMGHGSDAQWKGVQSSCKGFDVGI
jgi:hypothetical protein